jgi:hypothetical protein
MQALDAPHEADIGQAIYFLQLAGGIEILQIKESKQQSEVLELKLTQVFRF